MNYYNELNRMQRICMDKDSWLTQREFQSEPVWLQREHYNWMRNQVNEYSAGPYWPDNDPDPRMLYGGYTV